jgi:hypothetical protein
MTPYERLSSCDAVYLDTCALVKIDAKDEAGSLHAGSYLSHHGAGIFDVRRVR